MAAVIKDGRGRPRVATNIREAQNFIEEHCAKKLSLKKVAKAVNIHPNYLSEKFKHVTGMNFVEYVACTRFKEACDRLRNSNRRITEIAFAVGFQSHSQFNRVFKKFSGRSPRTYRAVHRKAKAASQILRSAERPPSFFRKNL
jgi:YesN/AraC family two-component response regulator